jgi:TetR/AcrR family transcriptional regulator, transcriptional repressor for nem operon
MVRPNVREKIVDAGLKVLIEKGFNGCGVQDITDAAGVPKGSFYNHFESKEALGAEVVERYGRNNPRRAALADTSIPPLQRLRAHFERLNEAYSSARFGRGCLLGNFSAELADQSQLIRERLAELYLSWSTDIATVIAEAQANGSICTRTAAADLAAFLLDAYEGALLRARVEKSGRAFDRFMTVAFSQILV